MSGYNLPKDEYGLDAVDYCCRCNGCPEPDHHDCGLPFEVAEENFLRSEEAMEAGLGLKIGESVTTSRGVTVTRVETRKYTSS